MKIESINIKNVGGIRDFLTAFDPQMNIVCGPNGVGKTTILECIAHSLTQSSSLILRRTANSTSGSVTTNISDGGTNYTARLEINSFDPGSTDSLRGLHQFSDKVLSIKINRTINYQKLNAVSMDVEKQPHVVRQETASGVNINEVKGWFVNRHLYSAHPNTLTKSQLANYKLARSCFSVLDEGYSFSRVMAASNEIMINSPKGEIFYEYLSSGFKSTLSIVFGIIKDIEFRFRESGVRAADFDGVILIDEIELHLHPDWQAKVTAILTSVFKKAQFVVTTHSPHVIQAAKPEQIMALESYDGHTRRRELPSGEFGFQGWTIEEVLIDVMGMEDTRTDLFNIRVERFGKAIDKEDYATAHRVYKELDKLLHPKSSLRKIYKLQLAAIQNVPK